MTQETKQHITIDGNHIYRVDGIVKPGFSEILVSMGFEKNPYWTDSGRDEGTALHKWFEFLARQPKKEDENYDSEENCDENKPDGRIAGKVRGISEFLYDHEFILKDSEKPLYAKAGYCCTPDAWGELDGVPCLIELKAGSPMKRHCLQTAAQQIALDDNGFKTEARYVLYLREEGYVLKVHEDSEDIDAWMSILWAYHAKEIYK